LIVLGTFWSIVRFLFGTENFRLDISITKGSFSESYFRTYLQKSQTIPHQKILYDSFEPRISQYQIGRPYFWIWSTDKYCIMFSHHLYNLLWAPPLYGSAPHTCLLCIHAPHVYSLIMSMESDLTHIIVTPGEANGPLAMNIVCVLLICINFGLAL